MSIGVRKSFRRLQKHTYFDKIFSLFYYIKQVDNILPLSVQLLIHGRRHLYNVVRTSVTHTPRQLVGHFFVLTTLKRHTVYQKLNRQLQNVIYLSIYVLTILV